MGIWVFGFYTVLDAGLEELCMYGSDSWIFFFFFATVGLGVRDFVYRLIHFSEICSFRILVSWPWEEIGVPERVYIYCFLHCQLLFS